MKHSIFVYGTLRKGAGANGMMGNGLQETEKILEGFKMVSMGGFPAIFKGEEHDSVVVDHYLVDDDTFKVLDRYEGYRPDNTGLYTKEEVVDSEGVKGWVYTMNHIDTKALESTKEPVVNGDWLEHRYDVMGVR